jgi:hypothetical protein
METVIGRSTERATELVLSATIISRIAKAALFYNIHEESF